MKTIIYDSDKYAHTPPVIASKPVSYTHLDVYKRQATDNGLAGVAFWKLGFDDASLWDTAIKYLN